MIVLNGKQTSVQILNELKKEISRLTHQKNRPPHLAILLVGNNPASQSYIKSKQKSCASIGIESTLIELSQEVSQDKLSGEIEKINDNAQIDGCIVQLPLPEHIDEQDILLKINPNKDVDGFHPENMGKLILGLDTFIPATPYGILELISRYNIETKGKHVVVIGRSHIVGRPMSVLLGQKRVQGNATVTVIHSHSTQGASLIKQADIIVVAMGIPFFLKEDMVKQDVIVIDVGISRVEDPKASRGYRIVGDVDYASVSKKCKAITPVPGGVGPMTIAMLLTNTLKAYKKNLSI